MAIWLAGSIVRSVTYHATMPEAARQIVERGVDLRHSQRGAYGQGFYTATVPDPFFGQVVVAVAIRTVRPLIGTVDEVEAIVDRIAR